MKHLTKAFATTALLAAAQGAHAVDMTSGLVLTIEPGVQLYDAYGNPSNVTPGSYFGMDLSGNSKISGSEKTPLTQGNYGVFIGGGNGGDYQEIGDVTGVWNFGGNDGTDYIISPVTGSTEAGLDFSGWRVTWNGIPSINMGTGAWGTGYSNGVANISWSGVIGDTYTLMYHATVPDGDPSGFGGIKYELFLTGTVQAVPEAETYAMMLAGLGLVGAMVSRRRKVLA